MNKNFIKIIDAAKSGDNKAFEDLYNMTKDSAYFVALSITKNEHDAMDILQDSYIKAFKSIDTLKQPEVFDSWLNKIVANNSKKYISKNKPLLFGDVANDVSSIINEDEFINNKQNVPHEVVESRETSRLVMEIIDRLSEDKRLIVFMYYYQEMMVKEIAETLDLPVTTIKYKLLSARQDMKKDIESLEKKGIKLYSVAPLAIISSALAMCAASCKVPAYASVLPAVMAGVGGAAGVVAIGGAASSAVTASVATTATAAATAVTSTTAAVATTAGGITGFLATVGGKIAATTLAVAVIGGGVTTAVVVSNNKGNDKNIEVSTESSQVLNQESSLEATYVETTKSEEDENFPEETTAATEIPAAEIVNMTTEGYSSMDSIKKSATFEINNTENIVDGATYNGITITGAYPLIEGGNEDLIKVVSDGFIDTYIEINGVKKDFSGSFIYDACIIDIDSEDKYCEVVVFDHGPSGDPNIYIFRYVDDSIVEVGHFEANYTYDSILFDGKGRIIGGRCYIDFIDTEIVAEFVEMEEAVAKTYTPDYSGLLNKKYTLTGNVYVAFKETEDMDAYPDLENLMTLEKGWEITFIKGDPREALYYIELPDGRKGVVTTWIAG